MALVLFFCGFIWFVCSKTLADYSFNNKEDSSEIMKDILGERGSKTIGFIILFSLMGWFAFNCEVFVLSLSGLFLGEMQDPVKLKILSCLSALIMASSGFIGVKGIRWLSRLSAPLLVMTLIIAVYQSNWDAEFFEGKSNIDWQVTLLSHHTNIVIGALMLGVLVIPDLAKHCASIKSVFTGCFLGFFLAAPLVIFVAGLVIEVNGAMDPIRTLQALGLGPLILVFVSLATWTTNDNNFYSASLAGKHVFSINHRSRVSLILLGLAFLILSFGLLKYFQSWLIGLSIVFPPVVACLCTQILLRRNGGKNGMEKLRIPTYVSYVGIIFGIVVSLASLQASLGGLGLFTLTSISPLDGMLVAGAIPIIWQTYRSTVS